MPRREGEEVIDLGGVAGDLALARLRPLQRLAGADVVGVARVGGDREVGALGEPGQRGDEIVGELAVGAGVEEHLVDVPVGVVVGEDRVVEVLGAAGGAQVAGRGADRVDRVVGVLAPVGVGVDPVGLPGRGDELHPADGAGVGDVEVGAEGGLDLVDRGEDLPGDPVLGPAGLVDRQQEGRDLERVDDEVGDADRGGPEEPDGRTGVGDRRRAVLLEGRRGLHRLALAGVVGVDLGPVAVAGADAAGGRVGVERVALVDAAAADRAAATDRAAASATAVGGPSTSA